MKKQIRYSKVLPLIFLLGFILYMGAYRTEVQAAEKKLAAPVLLSVSSGSYQSVTIRWKRVSGATAYNIYYKKKGEKKWRCVKAGVKKLSYTHTSDPAHPLLTGTAYIYTVRSQKGKTPGGFDKKGKEVIPAVGIPKLEKVSYPEYKKQMISWKKVAGASGYRIYRKENGRWKFLGKTGGKEKDFIYGSSKKFPIKDGVTYTYTVRAYRTVGKKNYYGDFSRDGIRGKAPAKNDKRLKDKWVILGKDTYYRENGYFVTGWKTINGKTYYFDPQTRKRCENTITGDDSTGYFAVDISGIRVTDPVVMRAVAIVRERTLPGWSREEKLKACFQFVVTGCRYRSADDPVSIQKMPEYASYVFQTYQGNCYRGAAALAYLAKVLGYEVRMGIGGVTAYANRSLTTHGWTEVKVDGEWLMCDTSMQRSHTSHNLFLVKHDNYPFRLGIDEFYYLNLKDGKVVWEY